MPKYSKKLRNDLLKETNNRCFYCGELLDKYEIEHVIPKSKNGTGTRKNLTVSCRTCNINKLDYSLEKFRFIIGGGLFYFERIGLKKGDQRGQSIYRFS